MIKHTQSIEAFTALGQLFKDYTLRNKRNDKWIENIDNAIINASNQNKWFTKDNLNFSISVWGQTLNKKDISEWLNDYPEPVRSTRLALVLAGNIPLVGLHDVICGLASRCSIEVKLSSNASFMLPLVVDFLFSVMPDWQGKVRFADGKLATYDKVIATGSNNTARYFEYYFKKKPHIIRKTRNGVAVLDGNETHEDLVALCQDITQYFGLGCRSVSHLMVPENYDFNNLFLALYDYKEIIQHNAYANNYDYNKAVYLMQEQELLENGFMMFKKDEGLNSPIACIHYSTYKDFKELKQRLSKQDQHIQCVVSKSLENSLSFGQTQYPRLGDYADHVDTVDFLLK